MAGLHFIGELAGIPIFAWWVWQCSTGSLGGLPSSPSLPGCYHA